MSGALLAGAGVYALLVFCGTAVLGFVLLPAFARAAGLDADAQGAFSFLTLKAVPFLVGASAAAAFTYPSLTRLSVSRRVVTYVATTACVWLASAAIAAVALG